MRFSLLLFIAVITGINVSCQTDTNVVPVAAYWKPGNYYDFKVTKIKRTWQNKTQVQNDSMQYTARFAVINADTAHYYISWTFKNPYFDAFALPESSRKKFPQYENPAIIYRTNKYGAYEGMENWRDVGQMMSELIHESINIKSMDTSKRSIALKKSLEPLLAVYSTQRGVEQLVFKELSMIHFPLGKQYTLGKLYHYTEQIPVMKNARPATGNGIIFIRRNDRAAQRCELVQRMKILPDSATNYLTQYFNSIGMRKNAIGSAVKSSVLEVNDNNIFDYLYNPGIPVKITVSRETIINVLDDRIKQLDETIIEKAEKSKP